MNSPQRECLVKDYSDVNTGVLHFLCSLICQSPRRETRFLEGEGVPVVLAAEVCALHVGDSALAPCVCVQAFSEQILGPKASTLGHEQ